MCLAIPGQIVEIVDDANDIAKVDVAGVRRNINITLVRTEGTGVGDWVLIHVGFALSRINEQDAAETLRLLESLGDEFQQEQDGFNNSQIE
jgi:hydrogenase expression/formation protein HypC